jgi:hypothetical protein
MEREFHIWGFTKRLCGVYGGIATGKGHTSLPAAKPRHLVARVAGQFKKFSKSPNQSGLLDTWRAIIRYVIKQTFINT